jgi:hypothetical protein
VGEAARRPAGTGRRLRRRRGGPDPPALAGTALPGRRRGGESDLRSTLADFPGDVGAVVGELVERGWVARSAGDVVALTADGCAGHDRVAAAVGRVRRHVADGVSAREYERTIMVLECMAENLQRALGD